MTRIPPHLDCDEIDFRDLANLSRCGQTGEGDAEVEWEWECGALVASGDEHPGLPVAAGTAAPGNAAPPPVPTPPAGG